MVVDALFGLLVTVLEAVVSALPEVEPLGLGEFGGLVGFAQFNTFLPLAEAVAAVGVILTVQVALFGFRAAVTLWQQLPFT